jgi:hypothetical protein
MRMGRRITTAPAPWSAGPRLASEPEFPVPMLIRLGNYPVTGGTIHPDQTVKIGTGPRCLPRRFACFT